MNYVDYVRIKRICCLLTFLPVMLAVCAMDFVSRHTGLDESWEKVVLFVFSFIIFFALMIYFVRMASGGGSKSSLRSAGGRKD
jgi:hypothetical protein